MRARSPQSDEKGDQSITLQKADARKTVRQNCGLNKSEAWPDISKRLKNGNAIRERERVNTEITLTMKGRGRENVMSQTSVQKIQYKVSKVCKNSKVF